MKNFRLALILILGMFTATRLFSMGATSTIPVQKPAKKTPAQKIAQKNLQAKAQTSTPPHALPNVIPKQIIHPAKTGIPHARRTGHTIVIHKVPHAGPSRYAEKLRPNNPITSNIKKEQRRKRQLVGGQARALAQRKQAPRKKPAQKPKRHAQRFQVYGDDVEEVDAPQAIEPSQPLDTVNPVTDPNAITLPAHFTDAFGKTGALSVGSRNGQLEAWCIAPGGASLLRYDNSAPDANKWVPLTPQNLQGKNIGLIKSVSISSDGEMMILDARGQAYRYNWDKKQFGMVPITPLHKFDKKARRLMRVVNQPLRLDHIAVGNKDNIWGVDTTEKVVYKLTSKKNIKTNKTHETWEPMINGIYVSVGLDGFVIAIDDNYVPHIYGGKNRWLRMAGIKLERIAIGTQNYIYGTYQGNLYRHSKATWYQLLGDNGKPAQGILHIAVNAVGTIFITSHGEIYHKGADGVLAQKKDSKIVIRKGTIH